MTFIQDYRQEQKSIMEEKMSETRLFRVRHKNELGDYNSYMNRDDYIERDSGGFYIGFEDYVDLLNIIKELREERTNIFELAKIEERRRIVPHWLREELSELREIKESLMKLIIKVNEKP